MENVFKMSDEIIKTEYPELELIDEEIEVLTEENTEEIIEEVFEEVAVGVSELNSDAPVTYVLENDNSDIIAELQKSNDYWNMFLDSYSVSHSSKWVNNFSGNNDFPFYITSGGSLSTTSNYVFGDYIYLPSGDYTLHLHIYTSYVGFRFGFFTDFSPNSTPIYSNVSLGTEAGEYTFNVSSSTPCYFVMTYTSSTTSSLASGSNMERTFKSASIDYEYNTLESYTLSELGNAVIETQKQITMIETCVLMMVVIFLAHTISAKFMRRKK